MCVFLIFYFIEEIILLNYNLDVIFFLVPNCPLYYVGAKLSGAKLSVFIMLVSNCLGAKLSYHWMMTVNHFKDPRIRFSSFSLASKSHR